MSAIAAYMGLSSTTAMPVIEPYVPRAREDSEDSKSSTEDPVKVAISPEARMLLSQLEGGSLPASAISKDMNGDHSKGESNKDENDQGEESEGDEEMIRDLKDRDREVRTHEQRHMAAAGAYAAGGPVYEYQTGPDGKRYAIGGHVALDTGEVPNDPQATMRKAQVLKRAATAVAEPSAADRQVATAAAKMETKARTELQDDDEEGQGVGKTSELKYGRAAAEEHGPGQFLSVQA